MTPIAELVATAMNSIKEMVDVNTIVGEPVETSDGTVIIPISRVSFGFGAGGTEFSGKASAVQGNDTNFGGGTGGGVSINPMGFLVVTGGSVQFLPVSVGGPEKLVDYIPVAIEKVAGFIKKRKDRSIPKIYKLVDILTKLCLRTGFGVRVAIESRDRNPYGT